MVDQNKKYIFAVFDHVEDCLMSICDSLNIPPILFTIDEINSDKYCIDNIIKKLFIYKNDPNGLATNKEYFNIVNDIFKIDNNFSLKENGFHSLSIIKKYLKKISKDINIPTHSLFFDRSKLCDLDINGFAKTVLIYNIDFFYQRGFTFDYIFFKKMIFDVIQRDCAYCGVKFYWHFDDLDKLYFIDDKNF